MTAHVHIMSDFDHYTVRCEDSAPVIWIEGRRETVSLNFDRQYRARLREALDRADVLDQDQGADMVSHEDGS